MVISAGRRAARLVSSGKDGIGSMGSGIMKTAVLVAALLFLPAQCYASGGTESAYAEGRIIVKLAKEQIQAGKTLASDSSVAGMKIEKRWTFSSAADTAAGRTLRAGTEDGGAVIALLTSDTMTTEQMLEAAAAESSIEYAEPDYRIYPASVPGDPGFAEQWAYNGDKDRPTGGEASIDIEEAWGRSAASSGKETVVAVVDIGVDYMHPDLIENMWDGSAYGYKNHGWNSTETGEAYYDPMDTDGHGTHVAGIIAAVPDNGRGVAGAARNVKILAAKVLGGTGGFSSFVIDSYSNLLRLKRSGVNLVATNNSWTAPILSKAAGEAMEALGAAGVINVIAAANNHADNDNVSGFPYNLASDYSIVVAASTPWDELAEFSNYGKRSVHIAAPGSWILSAYSRKAAQKDMQKDSFVKGLAEKQGKLFYYKDFTSAAGLEPGAGQSVSTKDGCLEWTTTAAETGVYSLVISADIDLASVNSESGVQEPLYLCTASISAKGFDVALCAPDGQGGVNRFKTTTYGNTNYDGNSWLGSVSQISDPYDAEFGFGRYTEEEFVWESDSAYLELSASLKEGETLTVKVKDIAITRGTPYDPDEPYRYMDGTSMAAPAAAGSLALIASIYPDMSPEELRARIIGGAVKTAALEDKTLSGGRLSVRKAMDDPSPVVCSAAAEGGLLTVEGFFFGAREGTLTLKANGEEQKLDVTEWTDGKITAELPAVPSGWCEAAVTRQDGDWGRKITRLSQEASQWEELAELPAYINDAKLAADSENGLIYIAGCCEDENMTGLFARYDIAGNKWQTLEDLPQNIYSSYDDNGNSIKSSAGVGFTIFGGKPTVVRNYGGQKILVAVYDGGWSTTEIPKDGTFPEYYEKVAEAASAKDGDSLLILTNYGSLWRVTPAENRIEKLPEVEELNKYGGLEENKVMTAEKDGVMVLFGGFGKTFSAPLFLDGERSWSGKACPGPESGVFSWSGAAFGWYRESLVIEDGTHNISDSLGGGARYDIGESEWTASQTGRTDVKNCAASVVVGDYLYRAAVTDFFNGVVRSFERLKLSASPEPEPEHAGGGGCSGGLSAAALLALLPLYLLKKKK